MNAYGVAPDLLDESQLRVGNRTLLAVVLGLIVLVGFGLRATQLSAEGLSEDELNKLNATLIYRTQGLTSTNGEHPFLMKALMTASTVTAERWNSVAPVGGQMSVETALRLPSVIFGACTALLIFFDLQAFGFLSRFGPASFFSARAAAQNTKSPPPAARRAASRRCRAAR